MEQGGESCQRGISMSNPGREVVKLAKAAGGKLISKDGHHEVWEVEHKLFRIATAGKRPSRIINAYTRELRGMIERQTKDKKKSRHV